MTEPNNNSPSTLEDALDVAAQIQPALNKLVVIFQRTTEGGSLTTSQVSIMNQLKSRGAARVSQVAAAELIRMPTASNALYQLEQRGFIERTRDEKDRRGVMVQLTKKGLTELEQVSQERAQALAEILRWLDDDGLQTAREISDLINKLAEIYRPTQDSQK
ncbi:MarR family transcriptional regulator [Corynebacterium sp.]|uniref:MarR family winged helix-turn-helix transcriptional regulator n=1 Tax=Corynebacterium sp. TaxID=1720 RepID=UPI0028AEACD7|nr:MarR family transcriptional regulator [Corynebacterium sp.]